LFINFLDVELFMRKAFLITCLVLLFFLLEFFLFNIAGRMFMPNFLLLLVIFFNLSWGIRYSLWAAILGGLLKDSFSIGVFGSYTFSFALCAYLTTVLSKYIYRKGSEMSRLFLVLVITTLNVFIQYFLRVMFARVDFFQTVKFILIPEVLTTLIVVSLTFHYLRKCVLKLSV